MKGRTAPWNVGLMGAFVLALLAAASCGGDDTGPVAGKGGALGVADAYARGVMEDVAV